MVAPLQGGTPNGKAAPTTTKGGACKPKKLTDAEIEESFREWYQAYPRKAKPDDARRAYAKLIKSGRATAAQLLAALNAYSFPPPALKSRS